MKIAPHTENWNSGERDWSYVDDPSSAIAVWRRNTGLTLPADYECFMMTYNGGRPYPRLFKHNIGPITAGLYLDESGESYVDLIFPWSIVESQWRGEIYGNGTPPGHLIIAEAPGGIQILLSLEPASFGNVFSWPHSTDTWGTERNIKIYPLAESFLSFLRNLYDDEDGRDYDNWWLPAYEGILQDIDL